MVCGVQGHVNVSCGVHLDSDFLAQVTETPTAPEEEPEKSERNNICCTTNTPITLIYYKKGSTDGLGATGELQSGPSMSLFKIKQDLNQKIK